MSIQPDAKRPKDGFSMPKISFLTAEVTPKNSDAYDLVWEEQKPWTNGDPNMDIFLFKRNGQDGPGPYWIIQFPMYLPRESSLKYITVDGKKCLNMEIPGGYHSAPLLFESFKFNVFCDGENYKMVPQTPVSEEIVITFSTDKKFIE